LKKLNLTDHDRPLNKKGKRDAPKMGKALIDLDIVPDLIISSSAKRAMDTAILIAENCEYKKDIEKNSILYASNLENYIDVISTVPDKYQKVLIVGHNPIIEDLVTIFINKIETIPTCTLVQFSLNIKSWKLLENSDDKNIKLIRILRPKELET
jgi:phosphohistidine phosphatase